MNKKRISKTHGEAKKNKRLHPFLELTFLRKSASKQEDTEEPKNFKSHCRE